MRTYVLLIGAMILSFVQTSAQRACFSAEYLQNAIRTNPSLAGQAQTIESFIQRQVAAAANARVVGVTIKIPVVVHILYHLPGENIDDEKVYSQIEILNQCFRRTNADTVNTPARFKSRAADCEIEFQLATSDPSKRNTNGIIHKYTPISIWQADDKMKRSSEMGDDGWDPNNYLNIWVCNIKYAAGYSSIPGDSPENDGVVINVSMFGHNTVGGYEQGRTAVHEVGHWLGLKHIWGDAPCGNDYVDDTPTQTQYNMGCPTGVRITCNNGPDGDMYSNYMDYTSDACVNLFTEGQKARMRALFASGGVRNSILSSYGLNPPLIHETPIPEEVPKWLQPRLYPNPAANELVLDVAYDVRWIGKTVLLINMNGQQVMEIQIASRTQKIDISKLVPGVYFISTRKEDGSYIKQKFIKM